MLLKRIINRAFSTFKDFSLIDIKVGKIIEIGLVLYF